DSLKSGGTTRDSQEKISQGRTRIVPRKCQLRTARRIGEVEVFNVPVLAAEAKIMFLVMIAESVVELDILIGVAERICRSAHAAESNQTDSRQLPVQGIGRSVL